MLIKPLSLSQMMRRSGNIKHETCHSSTKRIENKSNRDGHGISQRFRGSRERLIRMGISVGCDVQVLMNHSGRCLVAINDMRIAISHEAAQNILLAVQEPEDAFLQAVSHLKQIWAR